MIEAPPDSSDQAALHHRLRALETALMAQQTYLDALTFIIGAPVPGEAKRAAAQELLVRLKTERLIEDAEHALADAVVCMHGSRVAELLRRVTEGSA